MANEIVEHVCNYCTVGKSESKAAQPKRKMKTHFVVELGHLFAASKLLKTMLFACSAQ